MCAFSISFLCLTVCESNRSANITIMKYCTHIPPHLGVSKLCRYVYYPNWEIVTQFEEKHAKMTSIYSIYSI